MYNLEATKDSYSDSEEAGQNGGKKRRFLPKTQKSDAYASCKRLLFKVDLVIRGATGQVLAERPLHRFTDIFNQENRPLISLVCKELATKARYIVEERHEQQKQNEELNNIDLIDSEYLFMEEHFQKASEGEAGSPSHRDAQSAVEVCFSFYTIPQYVGLVRDQDVDYLSYDQDEILVNDDDHEDLIRVTRLINNLGGDRLEFEDLSLYQQDWPLYKPFNKKQVVRSIPYFFKSSPANEANILAKDYRVYFFDEIQRKIIYGILRRTYALLASCFLQHLQLTAETADPLTFIIQQKYFGALLHNQRSFFHLPLYQSTSTQALRTASRLLSEELRAGRVLNAVPIEIGGNRGSSVEFFFLKCSERLRNFQSGKDKGDLYERREELMEGKQEARSLEDLERLEKANLAIKDEPFTIQFWTIFRIVKHFNVESLAASQSLNLEVVFYLPSYKQTSDLNNEIVQQVFGRCAEVLSKRLQVMLLLMQTDDKRHLPKQLQICEMLPQDEITTPLSSRAGFNLVSSYSKATAMQTLSRMEMARKHAGLEFSPTHPIQVPVGQPQTSPLIKQSVSGTPSGANLQLSNSSSAQPQQSKDVKTSRIKARFEKYNKAQTSTSVDNNDQVSSSISIPLASPAIGGEPIEILPTINMPAKKLPSLKVTKVFSHSFNLYHSAIKVEDGINAIREKTFHHFIVDDQENLFVTKRDNRVYLIKISGQTITPIESMNPKSSILKSFSQTPNNLAMTHEKEDEAPVYDSKASFAPQPPPLMSKLTSNIKPPSFNQIHMDIYGTETPSRSHVEPLIQSIELNLTKITIEKLAENLMKHPDSISREDQSYIERSEQKLLIAFPISNCQLTDKFALLSYLKQSLSRFLNPVTLSTHSHLYQAQHKNKANLLGTASMLQTNQPHDSQALSSFREANLQADSTSIPSNSFYRKQDSFSSSTQGALEGRPSNPSLSNSLMDRQFFELPHLTGADPYDDQATTIRKIDSQEDKANPNDGTDLPLTTLESQNHGESQTIQFKQQEFIMLYNYLKKVGGSDKSDKAKQSITLYSIFGQSLALSSLCFLNSFNPQALVETVRDSSTIEKEDPLFTIMKQMQSQFLIDSFREKDGIKVGSLKLTPDHPNCTMMRKDPSLRSYMPLIFKSQKDHKFVQSNEEFQVPVPPKREPNQKWLMVKLTYLGQLQTELFVKNVILNVNQAINESLVELYIHSNYGAIIPKPLSFTVNSDDETKRRGFLNLTPAFQNESQSPLPQHPKNASTFSSPLKILENLERILAHGWMSITNVIYETERMIYGDSSDIVASLVNSFVTNFHQEFSKQTNKLQERSIGQQQWGITLIVELVNKSNMKTEKILIYSLGEEIQSNHYDELQRELKTHLSKTKTILRNIHPQFKLVLSSFKIDPYFEGSINGPENPKVIIKDFKGHAFKFDGLRPDNDLLPMQFSEESPGAKKTSHLSSDMIFDRFQNFKVYPSVQSFQSLNNPTSFAQIQHPRNFFFILTIKDQRLSFKSFNIDKKMKKRCKMVINNHLIWHSNRQHFFKRIVAQKLGTIYTLKDFYNSGHLVRNESVSNLFSKGKCLYKKVASVIEGKQVYNFTKALKRQNPRGGNDKGPLQKQIMQQQRRQRRRNQNNTTDRKREGEEKCGGSAKNEAVLGQEYMKNLKANEFQLRQLYQKASNKLEKSQAQNQEQQINNSLPHLHPNQIPLAKHRAIAPQHSSKIALLSQGLLGKAPRPMADISDMPDPTGTPLLSKLSVRFDDFVFNKVLTKQLQQTDKSLELRLTHMYLISPSLQPSRAFAIQSEQTRADRVTVPEALIANVSLNNKNLIKNPLFFHGMKMKKILEKFYERFKQSQNVAMMYKECEDLQSLHQSSSKKRSPVEEPADFSAFKKLVDQLQKGQRFKNLDSKVTYAQILVGRSRLLYSNTVQQLFDFSSLYQQLSVPPFEDGSLADKLALKEGDHEASNKLRTQYEQLKKNFINVFSNYLLHKTQVQKAICNMYEFSPDKQDINNSDYKSKLRKSGKGSSNNHIQGGTSYAQFRNKANESANEEGLLESSSRGNVIRRTRKFSDDHYEQRPGLSTQSRGQQDNGSNSSLVLSSNNQQDSTAYYLINRKRQERVLHQISEEEQEYGSQPQYTYIVKALDDDSLIIYELTLINRLIRINVYKHEDILKSFPRAIIINYNTLLSQPGAIQWIKDRKAKTVSDEQSLSTRLNADSINYDFHLKEIRNSIVVQNRQFNISRQIYNVLAFYKNPPKFAKNYINSVVLRLDLGYLNNVSVLDFMHYFCSLHREYGFKIFTEPDASPGKQPSKGKQHSPQFGTSSDEMGSPGQKMQNERVKYAFFKEEGSRARLENFEQNQQSFIKRTTSIAPLKMGGGNTVYQPMQVDLVDESELQEQNSRRSRIQDRSFSAFQNPFRGQKQKSFLQIPSQQLPSAQSGSQQPNQEYEKLYYIELRDPSVHPEQSENCDVYKKVWNVKCRKQEQSDGGIGVDDDDQNTVVELVFYLIYTNSGSSSEASLKDTRKNNERYPLPEVCTDMSRFITFLSERFSDCRSNFIKDQLWEMFFDQKKDIPLTDAQISDLLNLSFKYDLRSVDERYSELLSMDLHRKTLNDYLKYVFGKRAHSFNNHAQRGKFMKDVLPDLLIFDADTVHSMIYIEFSRGDRRLYLNLVRKDRIENEADETKSFDLELSSQAPWGGRDRMPQLELMPIEENLVKQVVNHIAFWLWKRAA